MCGKFKQKLDLSALAALLRLPVDSAGWTDAETDVTPGKIATALTGSADQAGVQRMRFGFASAPGLGVRPVINARSETMASKPLFRASFASGRCLIPAIAFYEQGQMMGLSDRALFCIAGLWQTGADGMAECVVVTRAATPAFSAFHDRMPLLLADTGTCRDWLLRAQTADNMPDVAVQEKTPPADVGQMALF